MARLVVSIITRDHHPVTTRAPKAGVDLAFYFVRRLPLIPLLSSASKMSLHWTHIVYPAIPLLFMIVFFCYCNFAFLCIPMLLNNFILTYLSGGGLSLPAVLEPPFEHLRCKCIVIVSTELFHDTVEI